MSMPGEVSFGGLNLFGEHRFQFHTNNMWEMGTHPEIFFGVEIAVHVNFSKDQTVTFASAGADFDA